MDQFCISSLPNTYCNNCKLGDHKVFIFSIKYAVKNEK